MILDFKETQRFNQWYLWVLLIGIRATRVASHFWDLQTNYPGRILWG